MPQGYFGGPGFKLLLSLAMIINNNKELLDDFSLGGVLH